MLMPGPTQTRNQDHQLGTRTAGWPRTPWVLPGAARQEPQAYTEMPPLGRTPGAWDHCTLMTQWHHQWQLQKLSRCHHPFS